MKKWKSVIFVCSLLLNVLLLTGLLYFKYYARSIMFKQAALYSNAMAANCQHVLSVLDANDSGKIPELKEFLKAQIESNANATETWEKALKK